MAFRFWKTLRLTPWLRLNLSKSGPSVSVGRTGSWLTFGPRGTRASVGIPGTGMFWTKQLKSRQRRGALQNTGNLSPGFFKRLIIPAGEEAFIDACKNYLEGDLQEAIRHLESDSSHADSQFLLGILRLQQGDLQGAVSAFQGVLQRPKGLGSLFEKHSIDAEIGLSVTPWLDVALLPQESSIRLALIECYQLLGNFDKARELVKKLHKDHPDDVLVKVSMIEMALEKKLGTRDLEKLSSIAIHEGNDSAVDTMLHLLRVQLLLLKGLPTAARELATFALRRKKDRPKEMLTELHIQRALAYEAEGNTRRAKQDFERAYAANPEDDRVRAKLNFYRI